MRLSKVLLRWYKSFNTRYYGHTEHSEPDLRPWEEFSGQAFPFVEIPIDRFITTIVGANESGKSHLLSAVAKALTGNSGCSAETFDMKDICRYCAFDSLDQRVWPNIGIEFQNLDDGDLSWLIPNRRNRRGPEDTPSRTEQFIVVLNGHDNDKHHASIFWPGIGEPGCDSRTGRAQATAVPAAPPV